MKLRYLLLAALSFILLSVSCSKEDDISIPSIKLEVSDIAFGETSETQTIQLLANRAWVATWDADWIAVEPTSGDASKDWQSLVITVLSNAGYDRTATIKINMTYDYRTITVSQKGEKGTAEEQILFNNNFDKEAATQSYGSSGTSWPYLDQFEGWKNESGIGSGNVSYVFNGMSARNNSNSNGSYSDYSGSGTNNLFFGTNGYWSAQNISVPAGVTDLKLTFGTERYEANASDNTFKPSEFHVYVSQDNTKWVELTYSFPNGYKNGRWDLATAIFSVPEGTSNISLYFKSDLTSAHRLDDVNLEAALNPGTLIDFSQGIELDGGGGSSGGGGDTSDAIYANDFDKEQASQVSGVGWPMAHETDIWKNHKGSGSDNVAYSSQGVTVRSNSASNGSYSDYSGSGVNNMFFGANNYLRISDIALSGETKFTLTFGTEKYLQGGSVFTPSEFHLYVSDDNNRWVELTYSFPNGYKDGRWDLATTSFSVPSGTSKLSFHITADVASAYRLDDFILVEADANATVTPVDFTQGTSLDGGGGGGGSGTSYTYKKVTKVTSGKSYLIVANNQFAAKPITSSNGYGYLNVDNVTVSSDEITGDYSADEWIFTESSGQYTIAQSDSKLLYMTGTYNSFNVSASPSSGQYWTVSIATSGEATITNVAMSKWIQYSSNYSSYGSYNTTQTGGYLPVLYEKSDDSGSGGGDGGGGDSGDSGDEITWTLGASNQTWGAESNTLYGEGFSASDSNIKVAYYKHTSTTTPITASTDHIRVYKNAVLVVTPATGSTKKIKSVVLETTGANYTSALTVLSDNNASTTVNGTTISWNKAAGVASFEAHAVNGQIRIKSIKVQLTE